MSRNEAARVGLPEMQMIGRVYLNLYELQSSLGQGSMGQVYLAQHRTNRQQVVLKIMHEHIAKQARFREQFQREMECMMRFKHPHAVALIDASVKDPKGPCLVMEYIKGVDLETLRKRLKRFAPERIGRLMGQLCDVLNAAHEQKIVHRDLKPSNLMVADWDTPLEKLKVLDFGLAQLAQAAPTAPTAGKPAAAPVTGAAGYLAPERIRSGGAGDFRSDIYSVGIILYELLSGRMPFLHASVPEVLQGHMHEPPPPFASALKIPSAVEAVVMRCLAKDPAQRIQSGWELRKQLEYALGKQVMELPPAGSPEVQRPQRGTMPGMTATPRPNPPAPHPQRPTMPGTAVNPLRPSRPTAPGIERPTPERPSRATMPGDSGGGSSSGGGNGEMSYHVACAMPAAAGLAKAAALVKELGGKIVEQGPEILRGMLAVDLYKAVLGPPRVGGTQGSSAQLMLADLEAHVEGPNIRLSMRPLGNVPVSLSAAWRGSCERIHTELVERLS